jgi:AcrR family transcriptional regulator
VSRHRDPDIDRRVLAAARELAAEAGLPAVTIADVATRARVSRPAIYRRWPSRAALLFEMQTNATVPPELPDLGDLRTELVLAVTHLVDTLPSHDRDVIADRFAAMIRDPAFARQVWRDRWEPDREVVLALWDRAVARGEVRSDVDGREVLTDLVAACTFRVYLAHATTDDVDVPALVDRVLDGVRRR